MVEREFRVGKNLQDAMRELADPAKSIEDNVLAAAYTALKTQTEFADWEDDLDA